MTSRHSDQFYYGGRHRSPHTRYAISLGVLCVAIATMIVLGVVVGVVAVW